MRRFFLFLATAATLLCGPLRAQDLRKPGPHPRLLLHAGEEAAVPLQERTLARADSVIVSFCKELLDEPPVERVMEGRRLLHTSREALKRIFWLSYTFRVHGGDAYARRAVDEMLAVSAFSDWNPSHFLDVGEMTMGVAIGYDWLYDRMTGPERAAVARAIIDKGLKPALNEADAWFYRSEINWNAVCNAGMVYGALAVWEEDPDFCRSMLEKSLESNKLAYKAYDGGGYPEGYNYWGYGTSFQIMLEAAVNHVFLSEAEDGVEKSLSFDFIRFTSTPAGHCFSFSDTGRKALGQYMQAWGPDPRGLYPEIRIMEETGFSQLCEERLFPMFLIGCARAGNTGPEPPEDHYFICGGTTPIFVYRSGWTSRDDTYLGIKGGLTMSSHSHCDQGSFYFESDGVTWATDLGMQDYNSLESAGVDLWDMTQDSGRWEVFRIGPFSHNIVTVNGHVPKVNHPAGFARTWQRPPEEPAGAGLDLTALYSEDLDTCRREVRLLDGDLHVVDFLQAGDSACTVRWAMCTEAEACIDRDAFLLTAGGHRRILSASVDGNHVLTPHIWPTTYDPAAPEVDGMQYLHPTDAPNPGTALVGYTFTLTPHQKVVLHVRLTRGS